MKDKEIIEIVEQLVEATEELNGEFQEGWDGVIQDGKKLLKHLNELINNK